MTTITFDPVDVLMLRGNRLFGGGVHGESLMPPWPSAFSGAVASHALAVAGKVGEITHEYQRAEKILSGVLGKDYALQTLALEINGEAVFPLPADLVALPGKLVRITPRKLKKFTGVTSSAVLPELATLDYPSREKPLGGLWITAAELMEYFAGRLPSFDKLIRPGVLWKSDPRLGIALDSGSRTAAKSMLYTSDAISLLPGDLLKKQSAVRFVAAFSGKDLPMDGLVRLGGDGRGAHIEPADATLAATLSELGCPQPGWKGFRLILATPGIFPDGWLPPGVDPASRSLKLNGLEAELVAASVPRHEVISGWDMAKHEPKPARKVVPTGSVYWFRVLTGDTKALSDLHKDGLWHLPMNTNFTARRREGFNRVWFGNWQPEEV